jgi:hypothetical protein
MQLPLPMCSLISCFPCALHDLSSVTVTPCYVRRPREERSNVLVVCLHDYRPTRSSAFA